MKQRKKITRWPQIQQFFILVKYNIFKEGQTIFVKNTGKNQSVRVFIVAVYFQKSHIFTHNNQKLIHQTPSFSATVSMQHQKLQSVGSTDFML